MANSKVLVKNDKVIVTEWSFDIGDSTGHHIHQYNYVVVPMLDGELKIIDKNNKTISNFLRVWPTIEIKELSIMFLITTISLLLYRS